MASRYMNYMRKNAKVVLVFMGIVCMVTFVPGFVSQECATWTAGLKAEAARRGLDPRNLDQLFSIQAGWEQAHPRPGSTLAQVADPDAGARADGPELGEPEPGSPAQIAASVTGLGPGLTRFEAVHQREAGDRRTQLTVEEVDAGVRVLTATFGVAPRPAAAREASAAGLRRCLQALLNDADDVFA